MYHRSGYSIGTKWSYAILLSCLIGISACSSSSDESPADDDPSTTPSIPNELRYVFHSSHDIELFWDDSTDDGWVMGYDIFRDDVLIAELLDANSYFEAMLEPSTIYQYRVVAVDDDGNRSSPADITLTTGGAQTLHQNAGAILNSMSGQDLIRQRLRVKNRLFLAMAAGSVQEVIGPTETVEDPSAEVPTVITTTRSIYQCNGGGTLVRTETQSRYSPGWWLNEDSDADLYLTNNCKSQITDNQSINFSLDGSFELLKERRSGYKTGSSTSTYTWRSLKLTEDGQGVRQSFFTDAQIRDHYDNDSHYWGGNRVITIAEFEHSIDDALSERLESVDYSQGLVGTYGPTSVSFSVSGNYAGRLSDNYQVFVSTESRFRVVSGPPGYQEDANGSFSMNSGNGDHLLITVLPLPPVDNYYRADLTSTWADSSTLILPSRPFFRYTMEDKPFAGADGTDTQVPTSGLGSTGPAGGIVFYITDDGLHGYEAAPVDQGSAIFGCFATEVPGAGGGAVGLNIGSGKHNTDQIVAECGTGTAADLANAYSHNGYNDWFLPSKDELNLMFENLHLLGFGGFASDHYWSSSLSGYLGNAWAQYFANGGQGRSSPTNVWRVRAVRAF